MKDQVVNGKLTATRMFVNQDLWCVTDRTVGMKVVQTRISKRSAMTLIGC